MNQQSWVDPRIGRLRADDVKAYLLRQGWKLRDDSGPDLLLFEGPPDDDSVPILQVLPASERMRDFPLRVEELIGAVGVLEGRPAPEVVSDILRQANGQAALPQLPTDTFPRPENEDSTTQ